MKVGHTKRIVTLVSILLFSLSLVFVPLSRALSFNYNDNFLNVFSISTNLDVVKPGSPVTATITGRLAVNGQTAIFHVTFSVDTLSQSGKVLDSRDLALSNVTNTAVAQLIIPSDALNNSYLVATVGNGTIVFSKIVLTLIQNPFYSELEAQVASLQADKASLQAQINTLSASLAVLQSNNSALQQQVNGLKTNNTNLQNQLSTLQASYDNLLSLSQNDKASLLVQINNLSGNNTQLKNQINNLQTQISGLQGDNSNLQTQLSEAQSNNTSLGTQLANLQANNSALQNQVVNLQSDKNLLLNQTATLQNQVASLDSKSANLQIIVNTISNQSSNLQSQLSSLQSDYQALQSKESTTSILMYLATFIAAVFIIATIYIVLIVMRSKGRKTVQSPMT